MSALLPRELAPTRVVPPQPDGRAADTGPTLVRPRRAGIADVPLVARRLAPASDVLPCPLPAAVLRLLLTHVALDVGAVWLTDDGPGVPGAAVAAIPPLSSAVPMQLALALQLELHLDVRDSGEAGPAAWPGTGPELSPAPSALTRRLLAQHWVLLSSQDLGEAPAALLSEALRVVDRSGLPALAVSPSSLLDEPRPAGLVALSEATGPTPGSVLLRRPSARQGHGPPVRSP